ncbi:MAG: sugar phosphate isomerase/epimerase family protein, partial [Anaerolineae bacterium]
GVDPVQAIREAGPRATLLHIKDGPANTTDPMVAVGEGVMDFPAILKAASYAEWLIVELDRCATDMAEAVAKSVRYLKKIA